MSNVFTKRTGKPRTTTLSDYGGHDATKVTTFPRILSPTRRANPHPIGLKYQIISQGKQSYGIWNPDLERIMQRFPVMTNHHKFVNFTCRPISLLGRKSGHTPQVCYTETTTSRMSYRNPRDYQGLTMDLANSTSSILGRSPARGIVPNLVLKEYPSITSSNM